MTTPPHEPVAPTGPADPTTSAGPTGPVGADPYRLSRRSTAGLVGFFLAIALGALSVMVGLPYVILKPGPITNTLGKLSGQQLITVSGAPTYPTQGALDFTTVRLAGGPGYKVTVWDLLGAAIRPSEDIVDEELYFPKGVTGKQVEEQSTAEMVDSQQEAVAVALKAVGQKVTEHIVVAEVAKDAPSASLLRAGDEIVSVDGKAVSDSSGVRDGVGAHEPGETVALGLVRDGKRLTVEAKTRAADGRATVGVFLSVRFEFPIDVKINAGDVGGPSAGTMFSLAVYDTLTPGSLTGGQQIAGTGTINAQGQVGPIGGIRQKLVGAHDGGAKWFLAPTDDCDDVVGHVPDGLRVVRIATFDEARSAVEAIAAHRADSLPTCTR